MSAKVFLAKVEARAEELEQQIKTHFSHLTTEAQAELAKAYSTFRKLVSSHAASAPAPKETVLATIEAQTQKPVEKDFGETTIAPTADQNTGGTAE